MNRQDALSHPNSVVATKICLAWSLEDAASLHRLTVQTMKVISSNVKLSVKQVRRKGGKKEKEERITQDKKPLLYFTIVPVTPHSSLFLLTLSINSFFFPHPSPTRQNVPSWTSLFNSLQLISMNFSPRIHHSSQQVNYVSST